MVRDVWWLLEGRWAKRGFAFEALNSLVGQVFSAFVCALGMIGGVLSWLDGQSYLVSGLAFLGFAFAAKAPATPSTPSRNPTPQKQAQPRTPTFPASHTPTPGDIMPGSRFS